MVLDATLKIAGLKGSRVLPVANFFEGEKKTVLGKDEFLEEVHIPTSRTNSGAAFYKLRHHQTSIDIAIVNAATSLTCEKEHCIDARIALGAVAETPIYAKSAEAFIKGKKIDMEIIRQVAEAASEEAKPIDDIRASAGYRKKMVAVLVKRALEESARRCGLCQR
jgi:carbon-monoxide dehydrogenase medium subunit